MTERSREWHQFEPSGLAHVTDDAQILTETHFTTTC